MFPGKFCGKQMKSVRSGSFALGGQGTRNGQKLQPDE